MEKLAQQLRRPVNAVRAGISRRSVGRLRTSNVNGRETLVLLDGTDETDTLEADATVTSELIDLVALERDAEANADALPAASPR